MNTFCNWFPKNASVFLALLWTVKGGKTTAVLTALL